MAANISSAARGGSFQPPQFHPIQLKLDRSNYAFWRALVHSAIRGQGLESFISSTAISPSPLLPTTSDGEMVPNPEFVTWIRRDQCLMSWMLSTVGETMLGHVVRCKSSFEVWNALLSIESANDEVSRSTPIHKERNLSVEDYFMKMSGIGDQLAAIGKPLDDDELIMHLMASFGPEYEALVVNTMNRSDSPNLQEIQLAFQAYEVRLAQQHSSFLEHSANVAYRGRGYGVNTGYGRGAPAAVGHGVGRGHRPNYGKVLLCQLCG